MASPPTTPSDRVTGAVHRYLSPQRLGKIDPTAWYVLAKLVLHAAGTKDGVEGSFVLAYRRRAKDDLPALQDLLPSTRSGAARLHHSTIGRAVDTLRRARLLFTDRSKAPRGAERTDPLSRPYEWKLRPPAEAATWRWPEAAAVLTSVLCQELARPREVCFLAHILDRADERGRVLITVSQLATDCGWTRDTVRKLLHGDRGPLYGIREVRATAGRDLEIHLGSHEPSTPVLLARALDQERSNAALPKSSRYALVGGWPGVTSHTDELTEIEQGFRDLIDSCAEREATRRGQTLTWSQRRDDVVKPVAKARQHYGDAITETALEKALDGGGWNDFGRYLLRIAGREERRLGKLASDPIRKRVELDRELELERAQSRQSAALAPSLSGEAAPGGAPGDEEHEIPWADLEPVASAAQGPGERVLGVQMALDGDQGHELEHCADAGGRIRVRPAERSSAAVIESLRWC